MCLLTGIVQKASGTLSRELESGVLDDSASLTRFQVGKGKVEDGGDGAILAAFLCFGAKMQSGNGQGLRVMWEGQEEGRAWNPWFPGPTLGLVRLPVI